MTPIRVARGRTGGRRMIEVRKLLRIALVLAALGVTAGAAVNVYGDDAAVRLEAEAVACPRGCPKATQVSYERLAGRRDHHVRRWGRGDRARELHAGRGPRRAVLVRARVRRRLAIRGRERGERTRWELRVGGAPSDSHRVRPVSGAQGNRGARVPGFRLRSPVSRAPGNLQGTRRPSDSDRVRPVSPVRGESRGMRALRFPSPCQATPNALSRATSRSESRWRGCAWQAQPRSARGPSRRMRALHGTRSSPVVGPCGFSVGAEPRRGARQSDAHSAMPARRRARRFFELGLGGSRASRSRVRAGHARRHRS